jgi:hypothetical protein
MNSDGRRTVKILLGGEWTEAEFQELEEGDIFRLYNPFGELVGTYKALSDPYINIDFDVYEIAIEEVKE